ncbi:MAG TPA: amino acid permease, partial [Longimicrobium sp.]|nr:amino acid permease [Longimicrobium sp.]
GFVNLSLWSDDRCVQTFHLTPAEAGRLVGFLAGVLLWVVGTFAVAAVSTIFADSFVALFPGLPESAARPAVLVLTFVLLGAVNIAGVRQGTRLNIVSTFAKLLPLLLLLVVGAFAVKPENLAWTDTPAAGDLARTAILLIFAFAGIESALVPSGEVKQVERTVPRAIAMAMLAITVLYIALHVVAQGILGPSLGAQQAPLAEAAAVAMGPWGRRIILIGAVVSMFGYVGGMTLATPRALFALGRDGFLPRALASVHPRYHTPHVAIVVQAVIVLVLALSSGFEKLAILANIATLLLYGACCLAAFELRRRDVRAGGVPFRLPAFAAYAPFLALAVIGWMLLSATLREWAVVAALLAAAAVFYVLTRGSRMRAMGDRA